VRSRVAVRGCARSSVGYKDIVTAPSLVALDAV
jgi:hypothetical protein